MVLAPTQWSVVSPTTANDIAAQSIIRLWAPNSTIFRQGRACTGLHILESGSVKLYVSSVAGREQILQIRSDAGPLSLLPLLDGGVYEMSARAIAPTATRFLPRAQFERLHSTAPDFAKAVAVELAHAMRNMISVADGLALKRVTARVASYIREQATEAGALDLSTPFQLPLTQEELAHVTGTTRESVARALSELRAARIIEQRLRIVRVLDAHRLAQRSEGGANVDDGDGVGAAILRSTAKVSVI